MSRRRIRSKKHARRRKEERRRRWKLYFGLAVISVVLLVGLTHLKAVQINDISVQTGDHVESVLVEDLAESIMKEPWLGLVSRNNILLLPWSELNYRIEGISPRIKSADIGLAGLRKISIDIENREAVAQVCPQVAPDSAAGNCRLVDGSGFIFASITKQDTATTTPGFVYTIDSSVESGSQLLPAHRFQALRSFIAALADISMYAQVAHIGKAGDVVVPVSRNPEGGEGKTVDLKVNLYSDLSQVVSNLQTVTENESFVTESSTSSDQTETASPFDLEYIDLRFDNKIFYQ